MAEVVENIKDKNLRREVRRNTSNQIVSYTLPVNSVEQYGLVKLPAVKDELNKIQFEKFINTTNVELTSPTITQDLTILQLNSVSLPQIVESKYRWTGEMVRIGSYPASEKTYYIEDGIYHNISGNGTFNFIAEKLKKPLGHRINDSYDYTSTVLDYGQNQYKIYDGVTYTRKSEAYLNGFELGDDITPIDVMPNGVRTREIRLLNNYNGVYSSIYVGGDSSTLAYWSNNKAVVQRNILSSIGDPLIIEFVFPFSISNHVFDLDLRYGSNANIVTINVKVNQITKANNNRRHRYTIDGQYITDQLDTITIKNGQNNQAFQPNVIGTPIGNT